jgi:hypothetical protein
MQMSTRARRAMVEDWNPGIRSGVEMDIYDCFS